MDATLQNPVTGELRWSIKQSFRNYVAELPDGAETRQGEIDGRAEGALVFPAAAVDVSAGGGSFTLQFRGGIRFHGHHGMLHVDVRDPWLEVRGTGGAALTADVAPEGSVAQRVVVATVDGAPVALHDGWEWEAEHTTLSLHGAALLGSVYEPGSDADGFSLRVVGA